VDKAEKVKNHMQISFLVANVQPQDPRITREKREVRGSSQIKTFLY
jgi:hypothetical protein